MSRYIEILQEYAPDEPYDIDALVDRGGALQLHLIDSSGHKLCLAFNSYVAYRKLDEGDSMVALAQLAASARPGKSFYRVETSEFIDWFVAQGHGVRKAEDLAHYAVFTVDDVVDVISLEAPSVITG